MLVAIFYLVKTSTTVQGSPSAAFANLSSLQFAFDGSSLMAALSSPQSLLFLAFALAFVIKVPMVPFHTWLPDAHVQAPTVGSVFLAAVLLKLGTYGLMRIAIPFFPQAAFYFKEFFILMGVIGIIYGAFCALAQTDFKKLVAYSSVSHMGYIMVGLFAFQKVAIAGSLYQMINHGISAGGLFLIVGFLYERLHTRNLTEFGGLSKTVPLMAIAFMIMTLSSVALPGSNGFVGEFPILLGAFQVQPMYVLFAGTGVILGAVYALKAYQMVMLGPQTRTDLDHLHDLNAKEITAMIVLAIFVFGIGFFPKTFFGKSDATLENYSTSILEKVGQDGH
jgi:NADH-quinone oxidoreductase subunit M